MMAFRASPTALLCAASLFAAAAASSASAQEGVAIKNLLGTIGLIPAEKDPIRYRERAPLVLPPRMELREPAAPETFASNNPQWPNDPDVVARKRRAAEQAVPVTASEIRRMSEQNPRLSIDEMRTGRSGGQAVAGRHVSDRDGVWVSPAELAKGARSAAKDDDDATVPMRRTLTDPPSVMRTPARGGVIASRSDPTVDQQVADANPINWLTRKFKSGDDD